jgi:hypothetical protein
MIRIEASGVDLQLPDVKAAKAQVLRQAAIAVEFARGVWTQYAQAIGPYRTGSYLRGIQDDARVTLQVQETEWEVTVDATIVNTSPHARYVEDGHQAFRLPDAIDWSGPNVKQGKSGPYLRIPFRHRAHASASQQEQQGLTYATRRAMMPAAIYARAQALAARSEGRPAERLRVDAELGLGPGRLWADTHGQSELWRGEQRVAGRIGGKAVSNPAWKSSKVQGMFRVARGESSEYLTVRVVKPTSQGWVIPAQQGYGIARAVTAELRNGEGGRRMAALMQSGVLGSLWGGR